MIISPFFKVWEGCEGWRVGGLSLSFICLFFPSSFHHFPSPSPSFILLVFALVREGRNVLFFSLRMFHEMIFFCVEDFWIWHALFVLGDGGRGEKEREKENSCHVFCSFGGRKRKTRERERKKEKKKENRKNENIS